jgi:hypothetical protein
MTLAESQRQYQATLEAVRSARRFAPVVSSDEGEWTEDRMDAELAQDERHRNTSWLREVCR